MCLGIPMQINSFSDSDENLACCTQNGIKREVNTYLLQDPKPIAGDYVLVHVGYAIKIIDTNEAIARQSIFYEMDNIKNKIEGDV